MIELVVTVQIFTYGRNSSYIHFTGRSFCNLCGWYNWRYCAPCCSSRFLQSHFIRIKSWGIDLVHKTINRYYLSQRNVPGQSARVGVSEGSCSVQLFGWVRNLKQKYRMVSDHQQREQEVVSLFGLFYGLLREQLSWLGVIFENVMSPVQLPRLDSNQLGEFSLPIDDTSIILRVVTMLR